MASLILSIADAVVTEINGATWAMPLVAQRHYRPQFELTELSTLKVSVVPRSAALESASRNAGQNDVVIDIAVQKKVDASQMAELDSLMELVEAVGNFFVRRRLVAFPAAMWVKTENVPIYSPEHLEQKRVFSSVLSLTYRVVR